MCIFRQSHSEHLQMIVRQLLSQKNLSASWEPVILNSVHQITHFVRPDVRGEMDDLDIRKYVHMKKVRQLFLFLFLATMFLKNPRGPVSIERMAL